jgi:ABC-type nitrate/sulfonate/bicarbonate transport system ATPase subunit
MIDLNNITFSYPTQKAIFQDFSWKVGLGQIWAVLGPSGCGKSTLLHLLAGLQYPSSGEISIKGETLKRPRPNTGLIIQDYGLLPWATVKQNVNLGIRIRSFYGPDGTHAPDDYEVPGNVDYWLERLQLTPHAEKYPSQLSGGQRQRTAIARTLALEPDLILMDEPFSSLDAPTRESLQDLVLDLQFEQKITMIIVTHSIEEASILGKHILLLGNPPNTTPIIQSNPGAGSDSYRESDSYQVVCRHLRSTLDEERFQN